MAKSKQVVPDGFLDAMRDLLGVPDGASFMFGEVRVDGGFHATVGADGSVDFEEFGDDDDFDDVIDDDDDFDDDDEGGDDPDGMDCFPDPVPWAPRKVPQ